MFTIQKFSEGIIESNWSTSCSLAPVKIKEKEHIDVAVYVAHQYDD